MANSSSTPYEELTVDNDSFFTEVVRILSQGSTVTLQAKGRSMEPFITDRRDSIVLKKDENASVGDIVLAHVAGKGYVIHRIYNEHGDRLTLMGDGNLAATEHCHRGNVVGKAIGIWRNGSYVDCSAPNERCKAACWRRLLPLRRYLLFAIRQYRKIVTSSK